MKLSELQRLRRQAEPSKTARKKAEVAERRAAVDAELEDARARINALLDGCLATMRAGNPTITDAEVARWRGHALSQAMPTRQSAAQIAKLRAAAPRLP